MHTTRPDDPPDGSSNLSRGNYMAVTGKVKFRDGYVCSCVAESLPWVEWDMQRRGLIHTQIDIFQYCYRSSVEASKGTHDAGGCIDVGQYHTNQITVWREWGWTMQDRSPFFDYDHGHGWPYKCPHLSPAAKAQQDDWDRKDAGLVGPGKVQGLWPVKPWKTAMEDNVMTVLDNAKLEIVKAVMNTDGLIANKGFKVGAGDYVSLHTAVEGIGSGLEA